MPTENPVVKINAVDVPEGAGPELEARFAARMGAVEGSAGFEGFELLRPVAGENRYFVYTRWADEESYRAWAGGGARSAHAGSPGGAPGGGGAQRPVSTGASLLEFEVVATAGPTTATTREVFDRVREMDGGGLSAENAVTGLREDRDSR